MDTQFLHEFKRRASFFFKDKIKAARLALLDATPAQLLTEEATNGDPSAPDSRTLRVISRAAFEVDDYWRIVDILHKRLLKYDKQNWRAAYKAMILLEHLLTHGPARVAEEFEGDRDIIREIANLQYVDEKGFNWGAIVQRKAERVLNLIEDESFLREERERDRKLIAGIKGFGSFCQRSISKVESSEGSVSENYLRCNSHFSHYQSKEDGVLASGMETWEIAADGAGNQCIDLTPKQPAQNCSCSINSSHEEDDHPFYDKAHHTLVSLLSSR